MQLRLRRPVDDGSCEYPEQYDCDGECINDENNNDVCDELDLEGMQDFSCNFNPDATIPDTSCIYPGDDCDDTDPETVNDEVTEDCGCEGEIPAPSGIDAGAAWALRCTRRQSKMHASNSVGRPMARRPSP